MKRLPPVARTIAALAIAAAAVLWPWTARTHDTESATTTVFEREVVRILSRHCVSCHSAGNVAIPLTTYEEAYVHARAIKTEVQERRMPPWSAMAGYGHYSNDNGLTAREIDFLVSWADGGKPRNAGTVFLNVPESATARPEVRAEPASGWQLRKVDLTRTLAPQPIAAGQPAVKRVIVELGLDTESWLQAIEYRPGNPRVVRYVVLTLEQTRQWLGSWTPWAHAMEFPARTAYKLPAGSRISVEVHYQGAEAPTTDEGTIALAFGRKPDLTCGSDLTLVAMPQAARSADTVLRAESPIAEDTWILALRPDVTSQVTSLQVSARESPGGINVLLFARDLRHDWPTPYVFKEPVLIKKGSRISTVMHGTPDQDQQRLVISRCVS